MRETFIEIDNPGAGNCFFYAIAIGLYHRIDDETGELLIPNNRFISKKGKELRAMVVDKIKNIIERNNNFKQGVVASEINRRIASRKNPNRNVSFLVSSYVRKMGGSGEWGGHPEVVAMHQLLQESGYKGLSIYDKKPNGKFKKLTQFGVTINNTKHLPEIKLRLHGVERGGMHFTTMLSQ